MVHVVVELDEFLVELAVLLVVVVPGGNEAESGAADALERLFRGCVAGPRILVFAGSTPWS